MERKSKAPHARCWECPLYNKGIAPTTGPHDAKFALVSRSPGRYDVSDGYPFAGPSGKVVDYLLKQNGLTREQILTTNVVLCETADPPKEAIKACKPRLDAEIANVETIIAGGSEAVKAFTGKTIDSARGYRINRGNQVIVATNNPALVLRDSDSFPNLVKDFKRAINPLPPARLPKVTVIRKVDEGRKLLTDLLRNPPPILAADIEARGGTTHRAELACIGFSATGERALVFGIETIADKECFALLKTFLEDTTRFIWHFGKYDVKALRYNGINAKIDHDSYALSIACDERPGVHSLEYMLMDEFGWPDYEPNSVKVFKKTGQIDDLNELYEYNGWDVAGTMQLFKMLQDRARKDNVYELYEGHLLPIYRSFVDIELRGFHYDVESAANLNEQYVIPKLWELRDKLREVVDHEGYNPNSPTQTEAIIYDELGLKHQIKEMMQKDKSRSTDHYIRKEIIDGRFKCNPGKKNLLQEWANTMEVYSKINKQKGTYIEGLIRKTLSDGKVYTSFKFGAVTGRTSSEKPNIQNITRSGHHGIPSMRTLFKPSPDNVIVQADYSQAELRCIAHFSSDPELNAIYMDSLRSLHKEQALRFYGEGYTKDQYVYAKSMNFGITYGQGPELFRDLYQVPVEDAQGYIDAWWDRFPVILAWTKQVAKTATSKGVVINPYGRKRRFQLITRENKSAIERQAVDFLPQSTASDFTLEAVVKLNAEGIPIVASVHDSIVADVPSDEALEVGKRMKEVMEAIPFNRFGWELPFLVDVSIGESWGSVEEVELEENGKLEQKNTKK